MLAYLLTSFLMILIVEDAINMNPLLDYFDLNKRAQVQNVVMLPLPSSSSAPTHSTKSAQPPLPLWKQLTFYLGTIIGVIFSSSIMQFQAGKATVISLTITTVILSTVIALVIMPHIYERALKPDAPLIIQLGLFVQEGVFWSVLLTSIGKAFG